MNTSWCMEVYGQPQVKLHFSNKAQRLIAQKAVDKNTRARELTAILETILTDTMYEVCVVVWL